MKNQLKHILSIVLAIALLLASVPASLSVAADTAAIPDTFIYNGDFEDGLGNWTPSAEGYFTVVTGTASSSGEVRFGSGSLKASYNGTAQKHLTQKISVERNTDYIIDFYAKLGGVGSSNYAQILIKTSDLQSNIKTIGVDTSTNWKYQTGTFNSGNNGQVAIDIYLDKGTVYFDALYIRKANNLVKYGDFPHNCQVQWNDVTTNASLVSGVNPFGDVGYSLLKSGTGIDTRQNFTVQTNTNYILSFYSKGTSANNAGTISAHNSQSTSLSTRIKSVNATGGGSWKKDSAVFNSGSNNTVYLFIQASNGSVYFDNISVVEAVSATINAEDGGSVAVPDLVNSGDNNYLEKGSKTTITATPNAGYGFLGWYDGEDTLVSSDAEYTFAPTADVVLTAKFSAQGTSNIIDLPSGDSTFEEGTPSSKWITSGTANYTVADGGHAGSNKSLYITTTSNQAARIYYKFKARKDTAYNVRFFAKGSLHSDNVLTAILTDHQISSGTVADNKIAGTDKVDTTLNTTTWQEISVALPVQDENSTDSMDCYLYLHVNNKGNVNVYVDNLAIAKPIGVTVSAEGNGTAAFANQFGGSSILYGDNVTFTATPESGHDFNGWFDDGDNLVSANASYTFAPTADVVLTAKFSFQEAPSIIELPSGDSTFEEGTPSSNWIKTDTANYEVVDGGHAGSNKSLYITTTSDQTARIYYKFKARKDTAYNVRFFAKGSLHSDNVLTAALTDHQISSGTVAENKISGTDKVDTTLNTTTWQEISVALPVQDENSTDSMDCYLYLHVNNKRNVNIYVDNLAIAKPVEATANVDGVGGTAAVKNQLGGSTILYGDDAVFTATPAASYAVEGWYNGLTKVSSNASYTIENVTEAVSRTAKFVFVPTYKADITNYDFETGTGDINNNYGWSSVSNGFTAEITDDDAYNGNQSLHFEYSGTSYVHAFLKVNVDADKEYKLRYFAKSSEDNELQVEIMHTSKWTDSNNGGVVFVKAQKVGNLPDWTQRTVTIPENNTSGTLYIHFFANDTVDAYIDDITVAVQRSVEVNTDSVNNNGYARFANQYGFSDMAEDTYLHGDTITLYSYPDNISKLLGWRLSSAGEYFSTQAEYSFELNDDIDIIAEFGFLGDFDGNRIFNATDFAHMRKVLLGIEDDDQNLADTNVNGIIDIIDLVHLKNAAVELNAGVPELLSSKSISGSNNYLKQLSYETDGTNKAGELIELSTHIDGIDSDVNVFDSDELDLSITLTNSTKTVTVPGFYYKGYSTNNHIITGADGDSDFRFRFTLPEAGEWNFDVTLKLNGSTVDTISNKLTVFENDENKGYIKASGKRFAYGDGTIYTPIGQNIAYSTVYNYNARAKDIIDKMTNIQSHGANFTRIWVSPWSMSLQKKNYAPNNLKSGMKDAVQFDELFRTAQEQGVNIQLVLFTHTMFKSGDSGDAGWKECVYNSANENGIIATPAAFFTDSTAKKQTKDYLRYMVARYGYAGNLFAWELMNEADSTTDYNASNVTAWYTEMTAYLKSIDPYGHMVTSSATDPSHTAAAYNSAFDFASLHLYYNDGSFVDDFISTSIANGANSSDYSGKPVMFGELGYLNSNDSLVVDSDRMHRQLWATLMSCGGAGASWRWDDIDENGWYSNYDAVESYAKLIDFENTSFYNFSTSFSSSTNAFGYKGSTSAYLWIYGRELGTYYNKSYTITGLDNGSYYVRWYDTTTGTHLATYSYTASNNKITINVPDFTNDIVLRVNKNS